MAGFAVMIAPDVSPKVIEKDFLRLVRSTAWFKNLEIPPTYAAGVSCVAVKLDSPASIHPGIVYDDATGSWILAAGTVVALEGDNGPGEVLLRLLRDYVAVGAKALDRFDGHFALVIYDGRTQCLSVISDPIGLYSIFYWRQGSEMIVSNSALAVAKYKQSQPDSLALEHFLRTGRLDGDKTFWQDVKRLLGGAILRAANGKIERSEYWAPHFDPWISHLSFEDALEQSIDMLTHTISRTVPREGKIWVDLTGGFDSRLVAMLVAKTNVSFRTYCMGPEDHPDVQLSRKISQKMKWDYVHTRLPEQWLPYQDTWFKTALGCGDGRANLLRIAVTLRGFKERNATIKTNVTGVGGESLRGYCWQIERGNIGRTSQVNYEALLDNVFSPAIPMQVMRYDRTKEVRQELLDYIKELCADYSELPNTAKIDRFEIGRDAGHGGAYLSAVTSIERSLAPLCFKAPVNFAFSLNFQWKYPHHHRFVRSLLERENRLLADLATTTGGPAVPMRLTNAHRFWPLWKSIMNRAVAIGSKKVLGKSIQIWPQPRQAGYPLPAWQTAFYAYAWSEDLLNHNTMRSAGLYKKDELNAYIEQAATGHHVHDEFLDRVISVEMAMRAVGSYVR